MTTFELPSSDVYGTFSSAEQAEYNQRHDTYSGLDLINTDLFGFDELSSSLIAENHVAGFYEHGGKNESSLL